MTSKQTEALKLALEALEVATTPLAKDRQEVLRARAAIREALAEQPAQQKRECNHCGGTGDVSGEYPGVACPECSGSGAQAQPEFIKHEVENAYDWSEWVCPDPESYLMKCCNCGLVHEAQFGVVRYKSETEREDCDMVDEPNLQAVFRMRRNEQWSPEDTAHRAGGLPMAEQPAQQQEPVAIEYWLQDTMESGRWVTTDNMAKATAEKMLSGEYGDVYPQGRIVEPSPPASKPWVGLTDDAILDMAEGCTAQYHDLLALARTIEAKLREKNA